VVMRAMANVVTGKPVGMVPDIRLSATRMREAIRSYYQGMGAPISDESTDVMGLADSLATILAPLYDDIRDTFAAQRQNTVARPQLAPGQA
jgi:hypothetical protein